MAHCHRFVTKPSGGGGELLADHEETSEGRMLMSLASHLAELQKRHSEIEEKINEALASPSTDTIEVVSLKRRKLALKDEIHRLRTSPTPLPTQH